MSEKLGVGIIGAGNISAAYLRLSPNFVGVEVRAVADINMDAASARAEEFGVRAETVDGLLASDDISIIINLTIPAAHFEVSKRILEAGKHVYSEKPLALNAADALEMTEAAEKAGVKTLVGFNYIKNPTVQLAKEIIARAKKSPEVSSNLNKVAP